MEDFSGPAASSPFLAAYRQTGGHQQHYVSGVLGLVSYTHHPMSSVYGFEHCGPWHPYTSAHPVVDHTNQNVHVNYQDTSHTFEYVPVNYGSLGHLGEHMPGNYVSETYNSDYNSYNDALDQNIRIKYQRQPHGKYSRQHLQTGALTTY